MAKPPPRRPKNPKATKPHGRKPEGRSPEGRFLEGRFPEGRLPEGRKPGYRIEKRPEPKAGSASGLWLYGVHAVLAALENPRRRIFRLLLSQDVGPDLRTRVERVLTLRDEGERLNLVPRETLNVNLPEGAVHQGLALKTAPLDQPALEDLLDRPLPAPGSGETSAALVILDQVSDPQNVGAILRSATAFGARGVVTTARNAPPETGALAKAASGALEHLPYVQVSNLARALERAQQAGFLCLGMAGEAEVALPDAPEAAGYVLVMGAEGKGMRRLTRERCDLLVKLPTQGVLPDLNVSNAAAVGLYALTQRRV